MILGTLVVVLVVALGVSVLLYRRMIDERDYLRAASEEWRDLADLIESQTSQPILMFDSMGLIRRLNPAAERLLGYTGEELAGQSILRLLPDAPKSGASRGDVELRMKDGSRVRMPFRVARSRSEEMYLFFEYANALGPVPERAASLVQVEKVVSRIVRQFESLLTTINGYTELALHQTEKNSPLRNDLEEIAAASDRASQLTSNLLAFSGSQLIPSEPLDLNRILESSADELRKSVKAGLRFESDATPVVAKVNEDCMRQVLLMLCASADHRTAEGESVVVSTRRHTVESPQRIYTGELPSGRYSVIAVSDQGPPLALSTLDHIFEPLFLDREAVGVELSPVYGVVRNLGGGIAVTSEEGRGTTVEVMFPHC